MPGQLLSDTLIVIGLILAEHLVTLQRASFAVCSFILLSPVASLSLAAEQFRCEIRKKKDFFIWVLSFFPLLVGHIVVQCDQ